MCLGNALVAVLKGKQTRKEEVSNLRTQASFLSRRAAFANFAKPNHVAPYVLATLVGFAVRLVVMAFVYQERMAPERDHYEFAYEVGRVAGAIASGRGFSDPLFGQTGPTALIPPVYPYILATIFRVGGICTKASVLLALGLNSLFSALTCIPVYFIARKSFGLRTATWACWAWALSPYGIYFSADWIWPTCLSTLLMSLSFLMAISLELSSNTWAWAGFGLLCGVAALNDPVVLSVLPILGVITVRRKLRKGQRWLLPALMGLLVFLTIVSPWFVRNYRTFHQFVPFRDGLGLELYVGNNGYTAHWANSALRLSNNTEQLAEYRRVGEMAFMAHKKQEAFTHIKQHPIAFVGLSFRRLVYLWTGYWSLNRAYLADEPMDVPNIVLCTSLTLLALKGLWIAFRNQCRVAAQYSSVLLCFPLVYYVTHPEVYYLRPIDPIVTILATYALVGLSRQEGREQRSLAAGPPSYQLVISRKVSADICQPCAFSNVQMFRCSRCSDILRSFPHLAQTILRWKVVWSDGYSRRPMTGQPGNPGMGHAKTAPPSHLLDGWYTLLDAARLLVNRLRHLRPRPLQATRDEPTEPGPTFPRCSANPTIASRRQPGPISDLPEKSCCAIERATHIAHCYRRDSASFLHERGVLRGASE